MRAEKQSGHGLALAEAGTAAGLVSNKSVHLTCHELDVKPREEKVDEHLKR